MQGVDAFLLVLAAISRSSIRPGTALVFLALTQGAPPELRRELLEGCEERLCRSRLLCSGRRPCLSVLWYLDLCPSHSGRHHLHESRIKAAVIRLTKLGFLNQVRVKRDQPHWSWRRNEWNPEVDDRACFSWRQSARPASDGYATTAVK